MLGLIIDLFYAVMFVGGGMALIKYRRNVKSWTGNWMWAEKYIGSGGTYVVLIVSGLLMIFFGVLYPFGGMDLITGGNTISSGVNQR